MEKDRVCPRYHQAVELIGRRWTGAIIVLLLGGRTRFHELSERIPQMSDRMLSERLKELEAAGVVERIVVPETPVRIEYRLTEMGRELERPVSAISDWASKWLEEMPGQTAAESGGEERQADAAQTMQAVGRN